ncbi:MAG: hypothetical protein QW390_04555, partial [Candidatus Bathyarchaeia archaeon]
MVGGKACARRANDNLPSALNPPKGRVLVIDDAQDTVEIIQRLLRYEGYDVTTASTGQEGVE